MGKRYFFFSSADGDKRFGTARDAWVENEEKAKELAASEGQFDGHESRPTKIIGRNRNGTPVEMKQDAALGLDGSDFHMGGVRVTKMKEECLPGGDVAVYWQSERGGTYRQVFAKTDNGRHASTGRPRKIFSF